MIFDNYVGSVKQMSIYRVSDAPPDWAQDDPSQPDYIKNKPRLVAGENIMLTKTGNTIIISAGEVEPPDVPEEPDIPDVPDVPDDPDIPGEEDTAVGKIMAQNIPVYIYHGEVEEEVEYRLLSSATRYDTEGFYVATEGSTVKQAGYQVIFEPSESGEAQYVLILKDANIINTYQYQETLGQWSAMGVDGTYWLADGEVTKVVNGVEYTYVKYVYNMELWGDPIMTTEYWRFELEV